MIFLLFSPVLGEQSAGARNAQIKRYQTTNVLPYWTDNNMGSIIWVLIIILWLNRYLLEPVISFHHWCSGTAQRGLLKEGIVYREPLDHQYSTE